MKLFSKTPGFKLPDPTYNCLVVSPKPLPSLRELAYPNGANGAVKGVIKAEEGDAEKLMHGKYTARSSEGAVVSILVKGRAPDDPFFGSDFPETARRYIGLNDEVYDICRASHFKTQFKLIEPGADVREAVLFQANLADRLGLLTAGAINDKEAIRYTLPQLWRLEDSAGVDVREHVLLHLLQDKGGVWAHTHGMVKFGRPEMEMYDLPVELAEVAAHALYQLGQHAIDENPILPEHTVGSPDQPLIARVGTKKKDDHWHELPVLELVDTNAQGKPEASGAARGLLSMMQGSDSDA